MDRTIIDIKDLYKIYRMADEQVIALNGVSASIKEGEKCCIFGSSGSGKSTFLNQLAGFEKPSKGQIFIGKTDITKLNETKMVAFRKRHIGFIFQAYNLLPGLTAFENVILPMTFLGLSRKEREERAKQMLERVGLYERRNHYPSQMSGGQQQRVGIARAFVTNPEIIYADEPTGNLDTKTTGQVMDMIMDVSAQNHQTIVMVTHDPKMAEYADHILTMIDGNIVKDEIRGAK